MFRTVIFTLLVAFCIAGGAVAKDMPTTAFPRLFSLSRSTVSPLPHSCTGFRSVAFLVTRNF
jgi:hypothetical protein